MPLPTFSSDRLRQPIALKPINGTILSPTGLQLQVDPIVVPNSEGVVLAAQGDSKDIFEVRFTPVTITTTDATLTIGIDIAAGGSLAITEYIGLAIQLHGNSLDPEWGPYYIGGDDTLRATSADGANLIVLHWNIKKVG